MTLSLLYMAARYYAAFTLFGYGFAKLMGAQFTILDSQLAKPMGDVSGFWLTWYYFGVSPLYSGFLAGAQIVGGILLCFRRTSLSGALLLLPVIVNIVCIDHWIIGWGLKSDAFRVALYVLTSILFVLAFHAKELYTFLLARRDGLALLNSHRRWLTGLQAVAVVIMLLYTAHEGYWLANVNNRSPTVIDGAWHLTQPQEVDADLPEWIYFEYNRAHMVVFQFSNGKTETHDFRIDLREHTLDISQQWLRPNSDVLSGKWVRNGDQLVIEGKWNGKALGPIALQRKQMPVKDHQ